MFNLFRSRQKAVRYVLMALLVMVALSMVTYLIPSSGNLPTSTTDENLLAEIGPDKVTMDQIQNTMQKYIQTGQIPAENATALVPRFVDEMILERASVYEFQRLGIEVSDAEVLAGLESQFHDDFQNGALVNKQAFDAKLAQNGETEQDLIDAMRYQLRLKKIQDMFFSTAVVSPKEVDDELRRRDEKAKIAYIAFTPANFRESIKPTEEEMKTYFDSHRSSYSIPEKHSFQVLVADQDRVEAAMKLSDADLRAAYAANMDNFRMGERVHVRHILIKTTDKSDAEKKQLLAKAQNLDKQLKSGADFAELAKKNSDDTSSAEKGGDLGELVKDQTLPELDKAMFALKPGEVSDVVTTSIGYDIVQVLEKLPAQVKPFEVVKAGLAADLKKQRVADTMQSDIDQARASLAKSPGAAAEIAKQLDLQLVTVTDGKPGEVIPTLGISPEIDSAVASLQKNQVSQVLTLPANRMAVVVLTGITPARPAAFEEVKGQVEDAVMTAKSSAAADAAAKQAADKLKSGEDIEKVAKEFKTKVTESAEVGPSDSVEGLGPAHYVEDAFKSPVGTILGPLTLPDQRYLIAKVTERKSADPVQMAAERPVMIQQLKSQKAKAAYELFMDSILSKLEAEGKVKVHQDAIKRLSLSFNK